MEVRDRAEHRRCDAGRDADRVRAAAGDVEALEHEHHEGERDQREHEDLDAQPEEIPAVVEEQLAQVHGRDERRERAGRVLDVEVAVRHLVSGDPAAPALVVAGVAEQPLAEHRRERDERPRGDEQAGAEQRGPAQVSRRQERAESARDAVHRHGRGRGRRRAGRGRRSRRTGRTTGCTCRASSVRTSSKPASSAAVSAASWSGDLVARQERRRRTRRRRGAPRAPSARRAGWAVRARGTAASPRARTASYAPDLPRDAVVPEHVQLVQRARLEQHDREHGGGRHGERGEETAGRPPVGVREPERGDDQRGELRPPGKRGEDSAPDRRRDEPEAEDEEAGMIASSVFELDAYCVNG